MSQRSESRRGLLVVAVLLVVFLVALDLVRSDSLIRAAVRSMTHPEGTPLERILNRVLPR